MSSCRVSKSRDGVSARAAWEELVVTHTRPQPIFAVGRDEGVWCASERRAACLIQRGWQEQEGAVLVVSKRRVGKKGRWAGWVGTGGEEEEEERRESASFFTRRGL